MTKLSDAEKQGFYSHYEGWPRTIVDIIIAAVERDRAIRPASVSVEQLAKYVDVYLANRRMPESERKKVLAGIATFPLSPTEPPAVSREQDTDKLLADLRARISARLDACGQHTSACIVDEIPLRAPVKPVWCEHIKAAPDGNGLACYVQKNVCNQVYDSWTVCPICGTPKPGQGEAR